MNEIVEYTKDDVGFYPTPPEIAEKMLSGIKWGEIHSILEPSAGKGDILRILTQYEDDYHSKGFDVDCIEIDANLRQILKYNFSEERKRALCQQRKEITGKYKYCEHRFKSGWQYYNDAEGKYVSVPDDDLEILEAIDKEEKCFFQNGIHIVHDDFLNYTPFKTYDLIVMNPPFSNGDRHLLKALKIQEKGGNIICLLNAETLKNPYTDTRRQLLKKLDEYNAIIEFIEHGFMSAERKTDVEVALIKVSIEAVQEESDIFNRMKKAEQVEDFYKEATELEVYDYIKAAISHFNCEVKSGLELIRQYKALAPYLQNSFDKDYKRPILRLVNHYDRSYADCVSVNDFLQDVRLKYWRALLSNQKFIGRLTAKLQSEYQEKVEQLKNYDFTEFNIMTLSAEMNAQIKVGIEDAIMVMFDRLTEEHSWYPETQKNRHYYDGWKTNKAHKIDKKAIIPCYGVFDSWDGRPRTYNARGVIRDIEKILNFFDGRMSAEIEDVERTLERYFNQGITKKVPFKFFNATFYKKGTIHIEFTCPELMERFNIYVAQSKKWLPPCYGKKKYADLTEEEKTVIDSFQGEEAYNEVLQRTDYYLSPITSNQLLLLEATE